MNLTSISTPIAIALISLVVAVAAGTVLLCTKPSNECGSPPPAPAALLVLIEAHEGVVHPL